MIGQTMYPILVATTIATTAVLLPFKEQPLTGEELDNRYEEILAKIPPLDCIRLYEMLEDNMEVNFWDRTYGTGGQIGRIRRANLLLQLVQLRRKSGAISRQDAALIWERLLTQSFLTGVSLLCWPWRRLRDRAARKSVEIYCSLAFRTHTLCMMDGTQKCLMKLDELL